MASALPPLPGPRHDRDRYVGHLAMGGAAGLSQRDASLAQPAPSGSRRKDRLRERRASLHFRRRHVPDSERPPEVAKPVVFLGGGAAPLPTFPPFPLYSSPFTLPLQGGGGPPPPP